MLLLLLEKDYSIQIKKNNTIYQNTWNVEFNVEDKNLPERDWKAWKICSLILGIPKIRLQGSKGIIKWMGNLLNG